MEHNLFKPKNIEEAMHSVVGDCNGIPMKERWEKETPLFAEAILGRVKDTPGTVVLDYGCGCGRIAKELLKQSKHLTVIGLDASVDELRHAEDYVNDSRFSAVLPYKLNQKVDLIYSIYCLQHVPAIDLRECLQRIHHFLKDDGNFIYCSSDYRMAVRFDGKGFFDDRFLGVNIQEAIEKLFMSPIDLWSPYEIEQQPILKSMILNGENIQGGIPHPAKVYVKIGVVGPLFNAFESFSVSSDPKKDEKGSPKTAEQLLKERSKKMGEGFRNKVFGIKKIILRNRLSPGDVLVMTCALRSLHKAYPGEYLTGVDTPCGDLFNNNPYVTQGLNGDPDAQVIDMHYPEVHRSGKSGRHFTDGHRKYLEEVLEIKIPRTGLVPDLFLTQDEIMWSSPVINTDECVKKYWVINAGSKSDYTLKQYHRWQEVTDLWNKNFPDIKLVQIGQKEHNHEPLNGVIDMVGETNVRELIRLIYKADGVFTCVSLQMHIAAALETPCVVVAGGREGTRWELYPNQRFLYTNGALDCCSYDGCWKSKIEDCSHKVPHNLHDVVEKGTGQMSNGWADEVPLCLEMIRPEDIVRAAELYYIGGMIKKEEALHAN